MSPSSTTQCTLDAATTVFAFINAQTSLTSEQQHDLRMTAWAYVVPVLFEQVEARTTNEVAELHRWFDLPEYRPEPE